MQTHVLATTSSRLHARVWRNVRKPFSDVSRVRNLTISGLRQSNAAYATSGKSDETEESLGEERLHSHHASRPGAMLQQPTRRPGLSGIRKPISSTRTLSSKTNVVTERYFIHQLLVETKDPIWRLLQVLNNPDTRHDAIYVALHNASIPTSQFNRWQNVIAAQHIDEALHLSNKLLRKPSGSQSSVIPYWVVLHLVASKIHTSSQARGALLDLLNLHLKTVPEQTHAPYLIFAAYHLSRFSLTLPLRSIMEQFLNTPVLAFPQDDPTDPFTSNPPPPPALSFNLFLQAMSVNPVRSVESANNVVAILKSIDSRQLRLSSSTYLHLLSDRFVTLQLTKYLQERMIHERVVPTVEHLEAYLRIFAREGAIHDAKKYLDVIHAALGQGRDVSQEAEFDPRFAANTLFLNAQDNRASAFGFLKSLVEETSVTVPSIKKPSNRVAPLDDDTALDDFVRDSDLQDTINSESDLTDLDAGLPNRASSSSDPLPLQPVKLSYKPYRDIYDLTAALHVAAKDLSTSTHRLIHLFMDIHKRTGDNFSSAHPSDSPAVSKPTAATYTVLIRGLLLRRQHDKAVQFWERFLKTGMEVDEQILAAGVVALTRAGKHHVAFQMLEKFCGPMEEAQPTKRRIVKNSGDGQEMELLLGPSESNVSPKLHQPRIQPSIHLLNVFLVALLRVSRPDVVLRLWTHMEVLYGVLPNAQSLSVLLQAARRGEGLDRPTGGLEEGWKGIKETFFGVKSDKSGGLNAFGSDRWKWIGGPFILGGQSPKNPQNRRLQKGSLAAGKRNDSENSRLRQIAVNDILTALGHPSKGGLRRYTQSMYHHQYSLPSPWMTEVKPNPTTTPLAFARKIFHQVLFANDYSRILPHITAPASYLRATYDSDGTSAGSSSSSSSSSVLSQALSSLLPLPTPFRPKRWDPEESMTRDIWTETGESWFPSLVLTNANFLNYIALVGLCGDGDAGVASRRSSQGNKSDGSPGEPGSDIDMETYLDTYFQKTDVDWSVAGPGEIPLVLARMKALGIQPSEATLALSLVLWGEVSVGAPLVERFGSGRQKVPVPSRSVHPPPLGASSPVDSGSPAPEEQLEQHKAPPPLYGEDGGAEYRRLVDWLRDWVGEQRLPHWRTLRKWQRIVAEMRANLEFGERRWMREDVAERPSKGGEKAKGGIFDSSFWEGEVGSGSSTAKIGAKVIGRRPPKC